MELGFNPVAIFEVLIASALGLCFGSFVTAVSYREPLGLSWVTNKDTKAARSQCPSCGHVLNFADLIPLFSWILTLGKCRYCKKTIGIKYPMIELSSMLLFLLNYLQFGLSVEFAIIGIATSFLLALFIIDSEHYILPNKLVVIVLVCATILHSYNGIQYGWDLYRLLPYLIGAIILPAILWLLGLIVSKLKKRESVGFGDVKLFAAVGLWLGVGYIPFIMLMAGFGGLVTAVIWKCKQKGEVFPFGPAIIVSLYLGILIQYGDKFEVLRETIQLF